MCRDAEKNKRADLEKERRPVGRRSAHPGGLQGEEWELVNNRGPL